MKTITTIIFDFDGLILDNETPEYQSFAAVFREHGQELPQDIWATGIGTSTFDPYAYLELLTGLDIDRESFKVRQKMHFDRLIPEQKVRAGVLDYISDAKSMGLRIGVASNSTHRWLDRFMTDYDLSKHFEVVSSTDDAGVHKPDPAVYKHALAALGASPDQAVAFEDSPNGIRSAKSAGIFTVCVPGPMTANLQLDQADMLLSSLTDVPLVELVKSIETKV